MSEGMADRITGTAQGLAVGDLMGVPLEGVDLNTPAEENLFITGILHAPDTRPWMRRWAEAATQILAHAQEIDGPINEYLGELNTAYFTVGETTDDTAMAVATMRSIIEAGGIDRFSLSKAYVAWYDGGRAKGMGGSTSHMLAAQDPKESPNIQDPFEATKMVRMRADLTTFPANGAAMRIPVVALNLLGESVTQADINHASDTVTRLTHPYPQCYQTSRALTTLTRDLVLTGDREFALRNLLEQYPKVVDAADAAMSAERPHSGGNLETFGIAHDALLFSSNYEDAVTHAINASYIYGSWATDSDTYAAVAGALAGAAYGASSIPRRWLESTTKNGERITITPVSFDEIGELALRVAGY